MSGEELLEGPCKPFHTYYTLKIICIFANQAKKSQIPKENTLKMVNNAMLNRPEISKAGILRTLYPTPLDFLIAYKSKLKADKQLVKKWRLTHYLSNGYKLFMSALTIKTKKKDFALKPVTLVLLLLPFKKVKGLNAKMLGSLFLFKGKVPETE